MPWKSTFVRSCGRTTETTSLWAYARSGWVSRKSTARMANASSAVSWMTLITTAVMVDPEIPRNAISPVSAAKIDDQPDLERRGQADPEQAQDVDGQDPGEGHHDARVDPVVEMGDPADHELGEAGELVVDGLLALEEGGLREVVGRAGARRRVEVGQLPVAPRGEEGEHEREQQARDHVHRRGRGAVRLQRLRLERGPQERTGRDQRHGVDREAGEAQGSLHLRRGGARHVVSSIHHCCLPGALPSTTGCRDGGGECAARPSRRP